MGLLPLADAAALGERVWPILLFVMAITVVTELAAAAGLFTVIAEWVARLGRGRTLVLWLLVVALATVSTIFLSLDTTAVLLTPVVIAVTRHVGLPPLPFALTTVWLANTASLLLPVSNLTNLLAASQLPGYAPARFALLMAGPAIVAVLVPCVILFLTFRKRLTGRYEAPAGTAQDDRPRLILAAVVVALIIPALVSGVPVWIPAVVGAVVLGVAFAIRRPSELTFRLLPWQLILFACGLFLVVATASSLGLAALLGTAAGSGDGFVALLRLSGIGAASSNLVNNLPAYLAVGVACDPALARAAEGPGRRHLLAEIRGARQHRGASYRHPGRVCPHFGGLDTPARGAISWANAGSFLPN
jgi:arsenical pump membrane protein